MQVTMFRSYFIVTKHLRETVDIEIRLRTPIEYRLLIIESEDYLINLTDSKDEIVCLLLGLY